MKNQTGLRALEWLAIANAGVMLVVALATCVDIVGRHFFDSPINGLYEASAYVMAIAVCGCLPAGFLLQRHVTFDLISRALRDQRPLLIFASFSTLVFIALVFWRVSQSTLQLQGDGITTGVLNWPVAPFWWGATVLLGLSVLVQFAVLIRNLFNAETPERATMGGTGTWIAIAAVALSALAAWAIVTRSVQSPITVALIGLGIMYVLVAASVPIAVAMGIVGIFAFAAISGFNAAFSMVGSETTSVLASMDLASVPLFLLMGGFAMAGGLAADLYRLAFAFLGHRRGGLCYAVITSCAAFGAICGSSVATTATIGRSTLGEVQSRGYAPKLVAGTIAAGGTLGALIPPSVVLIVYAILTDLSIRDLFIAAVVPGLFAVAMYFLVIAIVVTLRPEQAPRSAPQPWSERRAALIACWRSVLLFGVVLGGLYGGVFTTNEAAAVGAGIAFIFAFASGRMTRKALVEVLTETSANSAMIYLIVIGANLFGYFITVAEFPQALIDAFKNAQISPATLIIMLMMLYLALGCVFDTMAAMVITVPFLSPLVVAAGFDPVWWGIMVLVLVEVGMITPPIGMNVFVLKGVVGPSLSLKDIFKGVMPFIGGDLIRIAILGAFPILTLWLPHMLKQ